MVAPSILIAAELGLLVLTRSLFRLINDEVMNSDAFAHYNMSRGIRRVGHRIPEEAPGSFLPGRFSYPCLLHLALSLLPESWYDDINRIFSPLLDLLLAAVLVVLAPIGLLTRGEVVIALGLFVVTPQFVHPDHPHGIGLSARKVGTICCTVSLLGLALYFDGAGAAALAVALLGGAATALASRFSVQALVGVGLAFGLVSPSAPVVVAGALGLAVVVSGGFYARVLADHVRFSYDYATRKQYRFLYDGWKSLDTVRRLLGADSPRDVLEAFYHSVLLRSVLDNPFAVTALATYVLVAARGGRPLSSLGPFDVWLLAGVGLTVATSLYHLRFLGGTGRYLEHALLPGVVVVARGYTALGPRYRLVVAGGATAGVTVYAAYVYAYNAQYDPDERRDFAEVVTELADQPTGRVLVQPRKRGNEVAWRTGHSANDFAGNGLESESVREEWRQIFPEREGWVTDDVAWLAEQYDPDWVLFDHTWPDPVSLRPPPDATPIVANGSYELYPFEALRNAGAGAVGDAAS